MRRRYIAGAVFGMLLVGATTASAQIPAWKDRGFVNINFGVQAGGPDDTSHFAFTLYEENATVDVKRSLGSGAFFDALAAGRLWDNLALGIDFMKRSATGDGTLTGSLPDPIVFDSPRAVSTTVANLKHDETWVAIPLVYVWPFTDKVDIMIMGGPSVAHVNQDTVSNVSVSETGNGPQVSVTTTSESKSIWGVLVGADVRYMLSKQFGVGGFARYNAAHGHLSSDRKLDVGGFQLGGGLRVKF